MAISTEFLPLKIHSLYPICTPFAQDGIDFADFLGLAREHLDLAEVVKYLETPPQPPSEPWPRSGQWRICHGKKIPVMARESEDSSNSSSVDLGIYRFCSRW
jgi:hypothetical protein